MNLRRTIRRFKTIFIIILRLLLADHLSFSPFVVLFPHFPVVSLCFFVFFCPFFIPFSVFLLVQLFSISCYLLPLSFIIIFYFLEISVRISAVISRESSWMLSH
jgi:hypothetical protein